MSVSLSEFKQAFISSASGGRGSADGKPARSGRKKATRPRNDALDQLLEDVVGNAEKRAKALAKWKVPQFSEKYENATELDEFFADLDSGVSKVNEYVTYVHDAIEYFEKYGDPKVLEGIDGALGGVKKISSRLKGGLGKVKTTVEAVRNVTTFVKTADRFVDASRNMDPKDRESVKRWVSTLQGLWDAATPFLDWLQNEKLLTAAMQGSRLAGVLGATLPIVAAQLYVGIKALEVGLNNVDAYLKRLEKWDRMIDEASNGKKRRPPPPSAPGEWQTMEEAGRGAVAWEDLVLRDNIRSAHSIKIRDATQNFEEKLFPQLYRKELRKKIQKELAGTVREFDAKSKAASKKREALQSDVERLRDQLEAVRDKAAALKEQGRTDPRLEEQEQKIESKLDQLHAKIDALDGESKFFFDPKSIIQLREWGECLTVGDVQAQIEQFKYMRRQGKGFPVFDRAHDSALSKHLDKVSEDFRKEVASDLAGDSK